jgi:hypothetical protein
LVLQDPCTNNPGVSLNWVVNSTNSYDVSIIWWVVGGTASGGPIAIPANSSVSFDTPVDGPLPNTVAIMWIDPVDGSTKTVTADNTGEACAGEQPSPTPTASSTPEVLIPVTGFELPAILRDSMFLNLGIGVFGFALILLGMGIKMDRSQSEEDEEEYED